MLAGILAAAMDAAVPCLAAADEVEVPGLVPTGVAPDNVGKAAVLGPPPARPPSQPLTSENAVAILAWLKLDTALETLAVPVAAPLRPLISILKAKGAEVVGSSQSGLFRLDVGDKANASETGVANADPF